MAEEMRVLGGQNGVAQNARDFGVGDDRPLFRPDLPDDLSVIGQDPGRQGRLVSFQPGKIGQRFSDGEIRAEDRAEDEGRAEQERPQNGLPESFSG